MTNPFTDYSTAKLRRALETWQLLRPIRDALEAELTRRLAA